MVEGWNFAVKERWNKFLSRRKRNRSALQQVELEMAQWNPISGPTLFPKRPFKVWFIIAVGIFLFFLTFACCIFFKELIG
jgi:hypothetical protein